MTTDVGQGATAGGNANDLATVTTIYHGLTAPYVMAGYANRPYGFGYRRAYPYASGYLASSYGYGAGVGYGYPSYSYDRPSAAYTAWGGSGVSSYGYGGYGSPYGYSGYGGYNYLCQPTAGCWPGLSSQGCGSYGGIPYGSNCGYGCSGGYGGYGGYGYYGSPYGFYGSPYGYYGSPYGYGGYGW